MCIRGHKYVVLKTLNFLNKRHKFYILTKMVSYIFRFSFKINFLIIININELKVHKNFKKQSQIIQKSYKKE